MGLRTHLPSTLSTGTHLVDQTLHLHLVCRPHLAGNAVPHGVLHGEKPGQKIRGTAVGRRSVPGSGLTEYCEVRGHRDVTRHPDFLATRHPHAVHPADRGLLAHQDGIDHVIEQIHVLAVLLAPQAVILAVFPGVAARAKSVGTRAGKDDRYHAPVQGCILKAGYDALDHFRGVGIELLRIVESNPGRVQTFHNFSGCVLEGPFFIYRTRGVRIGPKVNIRVQQVILGSVIPWHPFQGHRIFSFQNMCRRQSRSRSLPRT